MTHQILRQLCRAALTFSVVVLTGCVGAGISPHATSRSFDRPLTVSGAIGMGDARRDASLELVVDGLEEDDRGRPTRAEANYQRAIGMDATNAFAYLALARHHLEYGSAHEASAFLDQARSLLEAEGHLGPSVDVWGVGLRAWIDRSLGYDERADSRFDAARELAPRIWADELLSADELR